MKNNLKEEMAVHIEQWSSSKLSKAKYCKQSGLTYHKFLYHLRLNQNESSMYAYAAARSIIKCKDAIIFVIQPPVCKEGALLCG